ncbi:MAG TPA: hypothetical protein VG294_06950 [Solirubrobacteraceae bacterium]|jgi:hypothetical protein|nr:hypothetical protein [Solirubrobacteraceae bacterium]
MTDPTGLVISLLEKLGVVWNVVRVTPERQEAKRAGAFASAQSVNGMGMEAHSTISR